MKFGFGLSPHPFLQVGQRVRVNNGCLSGLEGIIADIRKRDQLILSVTLLQRSVAVAIESAWVTPLHTSKTESKLPPNGASFQSPQFHHSEAVRQDSRRIAYGLQV